MKPTTVILLLALCLASCRNTLNSHNLHRPVNSNEVPAKLVPDILTAGCLPAVDYEAAAK